MGRAQTMPARVRVRGSPACGRARCVCGMVLLRGVRAEAEVAAAGGLGPWPCIIDPLASHTAMQQGSMQWYAYPRPAIPTVLLCEYIAACPHLNSPDTSALHPPHRPRTISSAAQRGSIQHRGALCRCICKRQHNRAKAMVLMQGWFEYVAGVLRGGSGLLR